MQLIDVLTLDIDLSREISCTPHQVDRLILSIMTIKLSLNVRVPYCWHPPGGANDLSLLRSGHRRSFSHAAVDGTEVSHWSFRPVVTRTPSCGTVYVQMKYEPNLLYRFVFKVIIITEQNLFSHLLSLKTDRMVYILGQVYPF